MKNLKAAYILIPMLALSPIFATTKKTLKKLIAVSCTNQKDGQHDGIFHDPEQFALSLANSKGLLYKYNCYQIALYRQVNKNGILDNVFEKNYGSTLSFLADTLQGRELSLESHSNLAEAFTRTPSHVENGFCHAKRHCEAILSEDLDIATYEALLNKAATILYFIYKNGGHGITQSNQRASFYAGSALFRESQIRPKFYQHAANHLLTALTSDELNLQEQKDAQKMLAAIYPY